MGIEQIYIPKDLSSAAQEWVRKKGMKNLSELVQKALKKYMGVEK